MGRKPCCEKIGLKRGPWTVEEDRKLISFIVSNGIQCWRQIPKLAGLLRCGKSCRLRWINYLRPDLKRGAFTEAEEDQIIRLHSQFGNRWSKIASNFPGRTDNEIKNHWNTKIKKKLKLLGLDPVTHKPIEAQEDCDTREPSSQSESSGSLMNNFQPENPGSKNSETSQTENGFDKCGSSDRSTTLVEEIEMLWEDLDVESTARMDASTPKEDLLQQWIDDLQSVLLLDDCDNLEEMLA